MHMHGLFAASIRPYAPRLTRGRDYRRLVNQARESRCLFVVSPPVLLMVSAIDLPGHLFETYVRESSPSRSSTYETAVVRNSADRRRLDSPKASGHDVFMIPYS